MIPVEVLVEDSLSDLLLFLLLEDFLGVAAGAADIDDVGTHRLLDFFLRIHEVVADGAFLSLCHGGID